MTGRSIDQRSPEAGDDVTHELQNGEHTEDWPEADRPFSADDSDAPVSMGDEPAESTQPGTDSSSEPNSGSSAGSSFAGDADSADDARAAAANEEADSDAEDDDAEDDDAEDDDAEDDDAEDAAAAADNDEAPLAEMEDAANVDIHQGGARDIDATTVSITQGGARDIEATTVTISQGGAARIRADELNVSQGGVALARTEHLTIQEGGSAFAVVADKATLDPETSVFLLIAGSTNGDVRPVMDWRAAAAFGAGFALILGILRRLRS